MNPVNRPFTLDEFYRRIDEMPISPGDRANAKASLRRAEFFADGLFWVVNAIRSVAESTGLRSTRRSMLRNSPALR